LATEIPLFPELNPEPPSTGIPVADSNNPPIGRNLKPNGSKDSTPESSLPLAHRMRPQSFEAFEGQQHLLAVGMPLRTAIESGALGSTVFWGPPGSGKTTLAQLIAQYTDKHFETFSAVTQGVPRVREIIQEAAQRRELHHRGTILFCDEIHRFNKAQQDAFLPHVEEGTVTLVGATTENPSFELNAALLSRVRVFVLEPLGLDALAEIVLRAFATLNADFGLNVELSKDAVALLAAHADGDARKALNAIEGVWLFIRSAASPPDIVTTKEVAAALQRRMPRFDKNGEEHFNQISALHKAIRGSDVEGALYWLARMLAGGEDPMYLLRRIVRIAAEDIGLTDPRALSISLAAKDAFHFLGSPEGELAIAEAVIYLATAPKSNRVYEAWNRATAAAEKYPTEPVPRNIRNAPTRLMRELGYGQGYRYDHDEKGFAAGQEYLPDPLVGQHWYEPSPHGFEKTLAERLAWWRKMKESAPHG
jgi:putative ATPase